MNERFLNAQSQFDSGRGYYPLIIKGLDRLTLVDRFSPFAPTGQKIVQTLRMALEVKLTVALFCGPDQFGEMENTVLLQPRGFLVQLEMSLKHCAPLPKAN